MAASRLRMLARPVAARSLAQTAAAAPAPGAVARAAGAGAPGRSLAARNFMPFPSLFREFDELFKPGFPFAGFRDMASDSAMRQFGHVDVLETKEGHTIKMDVPGMTKEDVKIQIDEDHVLTLSGERTRTDEKKEANYHHTERSFGKFVRSFTLPDNCKPESIVAEVRDGVLTVTIPHAPVPARRVVTIPVSEGAPAPTAADAAPAAESTTAGQ